ncbi:MAG: hypothetical protein Q7J12_07835, partial [Syntrophales bacterium]|nr:hypothetical protein [Syntrophales bacterium]
MSRKEIIGQGIRNNKKTFTGVRYLNLIFLAVTFMLVILIYVWSHIQMTELEYRAAEEMSLKEQLLEEQKKLKLECA